MRPSLLVRIGYLLSAGVFAAAAAPISGPAVIHDGDTVTIDDERVRLEGIDAPETDQICLDKESREFPCGVFARDELLRLIGNRMLSCEGSVRDQYGRRVARCSASGVDINAAMVKSGWALAYVKYSRAYLAEEEEAQSRGAGLWAGAFIAPWDWRHRDRNTIILGSTTVPLSAQAELLPSSKGYEPPVEGCAIKGNISRKGKRLYHLPGTRGYELTRVTESKGERWFCTAAEAQAAGWLAARSP